MQDMIRRIVEADNQAKALEEKNKKAAELRKHRSVDGTALPFVFLRKLAGTLYLGLYDLVVLRPVGLIHYAEIIHDIHS